MRVLGVDPGLRVTGYGVINVLDDHSFDDQMQLVEAGVIRTDKDDGITGRLKKIYDGLSEVVSELAPNVIIIEKLYAHYKHPATAILMGHARGAVCLVSGHCGIPLTNLAPTHVKKAVTGNGHANKGQVQNMVQHYLKLEKLPEPNDVADALAIAIAYIFSLKK